MSTKTVPLHACRLPFALFHLFGILLIAGTGAARAQGELFAADGNSITVYARTATGNVAPVRTISGALTGFNGVVSVAPDTVHGELVASNCNPGSVLVFALTADGNVAPLRKISGAATGLTCAGDVAVDTVNDEMLVLDEINNTISTFPRTASGNVAPTRVLQLAGTVTFPVFFALDATNNELIVPSNGSNAIAIYSRTASGLAATVRTISGASTGLNGPEAVAVDTVNNELVVVNNGNFSVSTFPRTATGNTAPTRTISGVTTGLFSPTGLALDNVDNELSVGNDLPSAPSITVYARTATGDAAPVRTIAGAATGLAPPMAIAVTAGTPVLTNAVSRKVHGAAGTFDLPLSLTVPPAVNHDPTTEPRLGPTQTIVFTFDRPINAATVIISEGTATAGLPTFSGIEVVVPLTGVSNQQYVTVTLSNVASTDGATGGSGAVRVGFLAGDVNLNRVVSIADLALVNAQLAQSVSAANYLKDVNASGTLSVADKAIANANLTKALVTP
jgi:hypothetical protein